MSLSTTKTQANKWSLSFTSDNATTATNVLTPASAQTIQLIDAFITSESGTANLITIGSRDSASSTISPRLKCYVGDDGAVPMNLQVPIQMPLGDIITVASSGATSIAVQLGGKFV